MMNKFQQALAKCLMLGLLIVATIAYADIASMFSAAGRAGFEAIRQQVPQLSPEALRLALKAYQNARAQGLDKKQILTVVDFTQPSAQERLYVINMADDRVLQEGLVANGHDGGLDIPSNFSDVAGTHASSIGLFSTGETFMGEHGYSLKINGLEPGINANARARGIEFHPAWYATSQFVKTHGRTGRSFGCFALDPENSTQIINDIKDNTLVFAYYPNNHWLSSSRYLV